MAMNFWNAPLYTTRWGAAYVGDCLGYLQQMPPGSVDLIMTSPPFALSIIAFSQHCGKDTFTLQFAPIGLSITGLLSICPGVEDFDRGAQFQLDLGQSGAKIRQKPCGFR